MDLFNNDPFYFLKKYIISNIQAIFENTITEEIQSIQEIAGSEYEANAAMLKDYDNEWDSWNKSFTTISEYAIFAAAQKSHTPLNYVYLDDEDTSEPLEKYRVVFYPHGFMMSGKRARILENYVAQGGTLILGCHSTFRNLYGQGINEKYAGNI